MIINFAPLGSGGGSGSGSTVSWQQTVTAGTQIAQITINGTSQNVYAPSGDGKIVVDFDKTSQAERAALYSTLYALYDGGSGDTINKTYTFYKSIDGRQSLPIDYYTFNSGVLVFGYVVAEKDGNEAQVSEQVVMIDSEGAVEVVLYPVGGGGGGAQDYVIVEALSDITEPTEGMMAFVKGTIAVDRLANVSAFALNGWCGGLAQFVQGEDYTIYRGQVNSKWEFPYKTGTPSIGYYWEELDPGLYIRYQGGNIWVAWNSEDFPNATMMGNNFKGSDDKWGEDSGQTHYITLDHNEGLNIYRSGKWVPMKKQYWFQDCLSSSALTSEICHRTAEGEMDITLVENYGVMTCQYSSPNTWNVGSTAFIMLRVQTSNNQLQYYRKFVNWDNPGSWAQDAIWSYTLPSS